MIRYEGVTIMIQCICESKLSTSYVFQDIREKLQGNSDPMVRAVDLIKNAKHLTIDDIEGIYIQLKQYTNSLSRAAISKFENGSIILLYNDNPANSLTQTLPFMTFRRADTYITYLFIDRFVTHNKAGVMNISVPVLHDLLVGAAISNALYTDYARLTQSPYLENTLMECYMELFIRILNREYAIGTDKRIFESAKYYIRKFFLIHIFGSIHPMETIDQEALAKLTHLNEMDIQLLKSNWANANPSDIRGLLELLTELTPRMKTLELGSFLSQWINMYYMPALFAVDTIEYVIFAVLTILNGNNIISIGAANTIKDIRNINSIREELLKLIQVN
jgi:hypothetical protein